MIGVRVARGEAVLVEEPFAVELTAVQPLADEVPVGSVEVVLEKIESDWVHRARKRHLDVEQAGRRRRAFQVAR